MLGGLATPVPFYTTCDGCFSSFSPVSPTARFCGERCKNAHWRKVYKRFALIDLFMQVFQLPVSARYWVMLALDKAEAKCYTVAAKLGYVYKPKKRVWVKAV